MIASMLSAAVEYEWSEGKIVSVLETEEGTLRHRLFFYPEGAGGTSVPGLIFATGGLYTDAFGNALDISFQILVNDHNVLYSHNLTEASTGQSLRVNRFFNLPAAFPDLPDLSAQNQSSVTFYWNGESVTIDPAPSEEQFFAIYGMPIGPGGEYMGGFISRFAGSSLHDLVKGYHAFSSKVPITCFSMTAVELCPLFFDPRDVPEDPASIAQSYPVDLSKAIIDGEEYILSYNSANPAGRDTGSLIFPDHDEREQFYHGYPHGNPVRECLDGFIACLNWEFGYYEGCLNYCYDTYGESAWRVAFCIWQCDLKESALYWMCSNRFLHCISSLLLPPLMP